MIWCLGMYASGSTWLFNAARQVAAELTPETPVQGIYAETLDELERLRAGAVHVVKTHDLPRAEAKYMAAKASRIFISVRDPRDAVVSLMQHMRHKFGPALEKIERTAAFCQFFAGDKRAEIFNYDAGFADDIATFDRLAAALGGALETGARERLFAASRRAAIEDYIAGLESLPTVVKDARSGDVVDTDTQWHRHHAGRSGEIGRWRRMLPPEAAQVIEARMGAWMRAFGFMET
jgi:hypothetical protein